MRGAAIVLGSMLLVGAALLGRSAAAQQPGTIQITAPANGATVSAPVTLQVTIGGVTVKPAAEGDPQAFHYHALIDTDPATVAQPGQPLPTGLANIIHTADTRLPLPDLAPGQHTVTVILTRTDHVPLSPTIQQRVTFTVAAPGAGGTAAAPGGAAQQPATAPRVGVGVAADTPATHGRLIAFAGLLLVGAASMLPRLKARR